MIGELAAEARYLDGLTLAQTADIDAGGGAHKHIHFTRPVIHNDDEAETHRRDFRLRSLERQVCGLRRSTCVRLLFLCGGERQVDPPISR